MRLPHNIKETLNRFDEVGREAYVVGGCVRDQLLGINPNDYDITTELLPDEIEALFSDKTVFTIGKKFGTIGVLMGEEVIEITTYRMDGPYLNHRKPESVEFTRNLIDDLARRDFTVNAMAYHPEKGLIDPFHGQQDLSEELIRAVGDPYIRLQEDGLRILRAIRFSGQLGFTLDVPLANAIKDLSELTRHLSKERIRDEVFKMLLQEVPSQPIYMMLELGVLKHIFPELMPTVGFDQMTPYHDKTLFDHIVCVVDHVPPKLSLRLAALFHDIEKPNTLSIDHETGRAHFFDHDKLGAKRAREILTNYHVPKREIEEISTLIGEHMKVHDKMTDRALRRQIHRVGEEYIEDLYKLMMADMHCTVPGRDMSFLVERIVRICELMEEGLVQDDDIEIDGNDLIALGMKPGPELGKLLTELRTIATEDPEQNRRDRLIKLARERIDGNN